MTMEVSSNSTSRPYVIHMALSISRSGIVHPQLCQQFIILPHHPKITTQIWVNLASSVTVYKCTHMSIHSIRTCSNIFCIYNVDVEKK
jgi:hypothetical protein